MMTTLRILVPILAMALLSACATAPAPPPMSSPARGDQAMVRPEPPAVEAPLTARDAEEFVRRAEERLLDLGIKASRAAWVQANFITYDTQQLSAAAGEAYTAAAVELAKEAAKFDNVNVPYDTRRKLNLLKNALVAPAPSEPAKTKELATILTQLEAMYGEGKYCPPGKSGDDCLDVGEITKIFAESRNPNQLLEVWEGWRTIAPPMKDEYERFVQLGNEGARELGYKDLGAMWRSKYDMPPDEFVQEVDRLWGQVKPLYDSLHCYVRSKLTAKYGANVVPPGEPIPAHLLGNIWAQDWSNIYDLVAPPAADPGYDLSKILKARKYKAEDIVRIGEKFFTSLGFEPLPETFWERSLFVKPRDREVVCHASAWDIDEMDDLRIKMCIEPTAEDFRTIHHELGHNFYQRAYNIHSYLYRQSANDGFHEAVGDTIALSVTPEYLKTIGLIDKVPPPSKDLGLLMKDALESIAFLPFGLLVDKWRWQVFSGEVSPAEYNESWWELREKYQGVTPPRARPADAFDPGAKYHIPGNTPYTRYFLARILQFQFHRSLCQAAGYQGPLNRCSIYGNEEAGRRLRNMLQMGITRPWPEALQAVTGQREMDATAIIDYFAPLKTWLDQQNRGKQCGW